MVRHGNEKANGLFSFMRQNWAKWTMSLYMYEYYMVRFLSKSNEQTIQTQERTVTLVRQNTTGREYIILYTLFQWYSVAPAYSCNVFFMPARCDINSFL